MSSLMGIGFFQFDNLIKNRVPFLLLSYGVEFKNFTNGIFQTHLEKHLVSLEKNETMSYLEKQKINKEQSMILICTDGTDSKKMADKLESAGYKNVYFINGGFNQLLKEKNS